MVDAGWDVNGAQQLEYIVDWVKGFNLEWPKAAGVSIKAPMF